MKKTSLLLLLMIYLGLYGNQLALWSDESPEPLEILPYQVQVYPQADQQALRHGIPITSVSELHRLAEDYFS